MKVSEDTGSKLVEELLAIPKFGEGVGLHRMLALCRELLSQDWMNNLETIKVTGSNGKGAVCAMVASILRELGVSCGLYTSPHLVKFNERIVVDGKQISDDELREASEWMVQRRQEYEACYPVDRIGAFELFTAIALYHFAKRQPEALVAEAGIGGRYDSTRIIPGKIVGLTSLDLEHTSLLGNTLEMIAYDKADLCPEGGLLVAAPLDPEVWRRLQAYSNVRNITLISAAAHSDLRRVAFGETHMELDLNIDGLDLTGLRMKLQGYHQAANLEIAVLLLRRWLKSRDRLVSDEQFEKAVRRAMATLVWPGRFERVARNPDVFIDVGHTPQAIAACVRTAETVLKGRRVLLVTGVSHDKNAEGIVKSLLPIADAVICTRAYHKGSPPEMISDIVRRSRPEMAVSTAATIEQAMRDACLRAAEQKMVVMVAGGLFLSIEARQSLEGKDPKAIRFF